MNITRTKGWRMYLTPTYWLLRLRFLIAGTPQLNIVEVFSITVNDDEKSKFYRGIKKRRRIKNE